MVELKVELGSAQCGAAELSGACFFFNLLSSLGVLASSISSCERSGLHPQSEGQSAGKSEGDGKGRAGHGQR
jgi:hypothetical protein